MKKVLLVVLGLLLSIAMCSCNLLPSRGNDLDALSGKIKDAAANLPLHSPEPTPAHIGPEPTAAQPNKPDNATEPAVTPEPADEHLLADADAVKRFCNELCSDCWWIYMGEDKDIYNADFFRFTYVDNGGLVFYTVDDFYTAEDGGSAACYTWSITDGKAMLTDKHGRIYRIYLDGNGSMRLVAESGSDERLFCRNNTQEAIEYLEQSDFYYLADYPPTPMFVNLYDIYGEDDESLYFELIAPVYIKENDTELIAKYGLENAYFDNGVEVVPSMDEEDIHYSYATRWDTAYYLCDWAGGNPALEYVECTCDEFLEMLERTGEPAYVNIKNDEGFITKMMEIYQP